MAVRFSLTFSAIYKNKTKINFVLATLEENGNKLGGAHLSVFFFVVMRAHIVLLAVAAVLHRQHHVPFLHDAVLGPVAHEVDGQAVGLALAEGGAG